MSITITPKDIHPVSSTYTRYDKEITFTTGVLAPHSDGAIEITYGGTTLLVTAVMQKDAQGEKGFLPLGIDFRESYYAAGKIGGGRFRKREGRPSDDTILYARLTDRTLRPLFPKGMINETVVTISPFSLDLEHSPWEVSIIGASLALMMGGIPLNGPVWAARIGYKDGAYLINPTESELEGALMDLHVAWPKNQINMIECGAQEVPSDILKEWLRLGQEVINACCDLQTQFLAQLTITPQTPTLCWPSEEMQDIINSLLPDAAVSALEGLEKNAFEAAYRGLLRDVHTQITTSEDPALRDLPRNDTIIAKGAETRIQEFLRERIVRDGVRADGRDTQEIRQIYCDISRIPTAHGTWLFWRGDTQALAFLTLWAPWDAELTDDMEHTLSEKKFMHHYKMPPFSNNEAQMIRGTSRREVGHGRLVEKALDAVIPSSDVFPYTIRLVSEILWSGWSTSMASTCASTLALMDGGVPISAPVSGIAMGMVAPKTWDPVILMDIMGIEDYLIGDMDFKLTGTSAGITAIQMDVKVSGVDVAFLHTMVDTSQAWREAILQHMLQTIDQPKASLSPYAPVLRQFTIKPEQIREVIGKGGETIQEITKTADVKIDIDDDGNGVITAKNKAASDLAYQMIQEVLWSPTKWMQLQGTIVRTEKYGVFVDLWKKKQWLVHVKNLGQWFVEDASVLHKVGERMSVEIIDIDATWKIQLKKITL